jgi:hypothetical protein
MRFRAETSPTTWAAINLLCSLPSSKKRRSAQSPIAGIGNPILAIVVGDAELTQICELIGHGVAELTKGTERAVCGLSIDWFVETVIESE